MLKMYLVFISIVLLSFNINAQAPCSLDNTFNSDGRIVSDGSRLGERIVALPDGSALIAYNPFSSGHAYVRHILNDGSIDNSYGTSGKTIIQVASLRTDINALLVLNNELYICGSTGTGSNTYAFVSKLKANGFVDATFGNAGLVEFPTFFTFNDMIFEPSTNKLIVAGMKSVNKATIARLHTNGFMDGTFANLGTTDIPSANTSTYYLIDDINIDKLNKYIITGKHYTTMGSATFTQLVVMRFDANGALDTSFDTDGKAFYNSLSSGSHEEGRKIFANSMNEYYICAASYVNGSNWNYALLKIKNDGSPQNSFGTNGWKIYDLTNQGETETLLNGEMMSNEHILLTGNQGSGDTVHFALLMVKPDGSLDHSFAPNGLFLNIFGSNNNSSSSGLAITQDGKIYLSGYTRTCTGGTCGPLYLAVARYFGANYPNTVNSIDHDNAIAIYPNPVPTEGRFRIDFANHDILSVHAINLLGENVSLTSSGNHSYQLENPTKGVYFLKIEMQDKQVYTRSIVVE